MPLALKCQVNGLENLMDRLYAIKLALRHKILRAAVEDGSKILRDEAKARVPKRTGLLRRALGLKIKTYPSGVVLGVIGVRKDFRTVRDAATGKLIRRTKKNRERFRAAVAAGGTILDPNKYLHLVELGRKAVRAGFTKGKPTTATVLSDGATVWGKRVQQVRPRPFLRQTYAARREAVVRRLAEVIRAGVDAAARAAR